MIRHKEAIQTRLVRLTSALTVLKWNERRRKGEITSRELASFVIDIFKLFFAFLLRNQFREILFRTTTSDSWKEEENVYVELAKGKNLIENHVMLAGIKVLNGTTMLTNRLIASIILLMSKDRWSNSVDKVLGKVGKQAALSRHAIPLVIVEWKLKVSLRVFAEVHAKWSLLENNCASSQ